MKTKTVKQSDSCFDRFKPGKLAFDEDGNIIIKGV